MSELQLFVKSIYWPDTENEQMRQEHADDGMEMTYFSDEGGAGVRVWKDGVLIEQHNARYIESIIFDTERNEK